MALYGNLVTMSLPELLGWIADKRKSGLLRLDHDSVSTRIEWNEGSITGCVSDDPPTLLGQFLIFRGVINDEQLQCAMSEQEATGRSLRDILVDNDIVRRVELDLEAATKAEETILGLFDLDTGAFGFCESEQAGPNVTAVELEVQDLLLRWNQRREVRTRADEILGHADTVLGRTDKQPSARLRYDLPCLRVYEATDGHSTIEETILRTHGTEYRVVANLLRLHDEGLVEVVRRSRSATQPDGSVDAAPAPEPSEQALRRMIEEKSSAPVETLEESGIDLDRIPVLIRCRDEIAREGISPLEGFLLDMIDGAWDVRSMTWIAPIRTSDVLNTLSRMQERGLIELSEPSCRGTAPPRSVPASG